MPTLYLKVSNETSRYLADLANAAGTSKSQAADLILTYARDHGWTVLPGAPRIDPGRDMDTAAGAGHSSATEG